MIETPPAVAQLVAPWAHFYGHSKVVSTGVVFFHVASLIVGGGLAITLDRATLRESRGNRAHRAAHLQALGDAHRVVIGSLAVALASGIALLAADLDTFLGSTVFWLKMALLLALLANGGMMTRIESRLHADVGDPDGDWRALRPIASTSIALWMALTLAGVALTSAA